MEPIEIIMECTFVLLNPQTQNLIVNNSEIKQTESGVRYLKLII
jgi:hypothetical protein